MVKANSKRMKILLVRVPEIEFNSLSSDMRNISVSSISVPLGIAYISSVIRQDGNHDVQILDLYAKHYQKFISDFKTNPGEVLNIAKNDIMGAIDEYKPDIVGFSAVFNFQHALVKELVDSVKRYVPNVRTYLGGYPTVFPEMVLNSIPSLDILFIGEAENTILDVLEAASVNQAPRSIKGIASRIGGEVYLSSSLNLPLNLDSIPYPTFDMLPLESYRRIIGRNELPLMTSRGCPFSCNFCSSRLYSGRKFRLRSIENLFNEVELMLSNYSMDFMWIRDDNFIVNKSHAKNFLMGMIKRGLTVPWCDSSAFHVNSLDEELLELCKASGCVEVIFAIESGSRRVLKDIMNKNVDLDHAMKMAKFCRSIALPLQCYFVIGNPGETKDEMKQTIDYAVELQVDHCTFSIATPFPGTRYYELALEKGYLIHEPDYILGMKYMEANIQTEHFSSDELKDIQYDANIRVNFLENRLLNGDRKSLEKAFKKFTRVAEQYQFHAVARLIEGYLHGVLGDTKLSHEVFTRVREMLKDIEIKKAYGKYFQWNTPATNAYRQWEANNKYDEHAL